MFMYVHVPETRVGRTDDRISHSTKAGQVLPGGSRTVGFRQDVSYQNEISALTASVSASMDHDTAE